MAENTKIEWADHTFNPWEGCQKVGPGCDNWYAEARNARFAGGTAINWGPGAPRRRTSVANWQQPIKWEREAKAKGIRDRVFCASLADVFDNAVEPQWRCDWWQLIQDTPHLDWLLLTKRVGNVFKMLPDGWAFGHGAWNNVWIGATVVNQAEADRDIPKLLAIPAVKRFLSMEPLLGPVDLTRIRIPLAAHSHAVVNALHHKDSLNLGKPSCAIDWVIVGGESGPNARPMHPDWARSLRDQCQATGTAFLFKQWGEWIGVPDLRKLPGGTGPGFGAFDHCTFDQEHEAVRVSKRAAGRMLDGRTWDEVPS